MATPGLFMAGDVCPVADKADNFLGGGTTPNVHQAGFSLIRG